jgi:hypothetical protein
VIYPGYSDDLAKGIALGEQQLARQGGDAAPEFPPELKGKPIRELKAMLIVAAKADVDLND